MLKYLSAACVAATLLAMGSGPVQAQTLVVAAVTTPKGVDPDFFLPRSTESVVNIYEGLTRYATKIEKGLPVVDGRKVEPHLAESWTVTDDGLVYVFKLRQGVKSAYGNELTADDVVFGVEKSRWHKLAGNFVLNSAKVVKVEALSRYEVRWTLSAPNRIFLAALTTYLPGVFDSVEAKKHATAEDPFATKWLATNSAGFGAYHVQSLQPGTGAVFVANPNYFGPKTYYQRVVYRDVPSAATRTALLKSGDVQWAENIPIQQLTELLKDPKVKVEANPGSASANIRMNPKMKPFDDPKVRQAMVYATDFEAIGEAVFRGLGTRARSILSPAFVGAVEAYRYDYDPAKARALLAEAGHPNGIDVTVEYSDAYWWEEPLAIQFKDSAAKAGIRVTTQRITATELNTRRAIGKRNLAMATQFSNALVLDPGYALFLLAHSAGSQNFNDYSNPAVDKLIEQIIVERDDAKMLAMVAEVQRLHAADASFIDTFYPGTYEAMAPCITGWTWTPHNRAVWRHLECKR